MDENPFEALKIPDKPPKRYVAPQPPWTPRRVVAICLRVIFAFALLTAIRMGIGAFSAPENDRPLVVGTAIGAAVVSLLAWCGAHLLGFRPQE
ncbi:MAG: hypothetical protein K8T25_00475 [Planctomycetia bacterium]|nr:hypothetical protein [Planctomycetia bacterium]